jgi:hypothetical protein
MSERDAQFFSTKLHKLVWAADFASFCETGSTISGARYQREKFGPVPKAMPIILDRLKDEKRIEFRKVTVGTKEGFRPVALDAADLSRFSQRQLMIVDKVIAENFGKTGKQLSDESHDKLAWKVLENGDLIPFAAWFVTSRHPTPSERQVGLELEEVARAYHGQA